MNQKSKNGFAIIRCCFLFLAKGKANKVLTLPRRIMIVQTAQLGDMICTTPMFRAVKKQYPSAELIVMGNAGNKALLQGNSDVDRYVVYEHSKDIKALISEVRELGVDAACITAPDYRLLSILYLARIPLIVVPKVVNGWSPYQLRLYSMLRNIAVVKPHVMGSYAPREYLRLLEPLGISSHDTKKYLGFSSHARQHVDSFLKNQGVVLGQDILIGISASAGNEIKKWPAQRFAAVVDHVMSSYKARVVLIGGPDDGADVAATLSHVMKPGKVINAQGKFNIDQLKALIASLNMFIAVDTGPIYIAEAFGVPTIDIIGPIDEKEQPPISNIHRVVVASRQAPELHVMNARRYDENEARRQVEAITVEMVTVAFDELAIKIK